VAGGGENAMDIGATSEESCSDPTFRRSINIVYVLTERVGVLSPKSDQVDET
jgi:hypothetical protein